MRTPLKMRDGVALAPTDPGERCLRSVPWLLDRPRKPWRRMTPANPLPFESATTSTRSPLANTSARISWPISNPSVAERRSSARWRIGGSDAAFRCPSSGLLILRSGTSPKASWMAV